MKNAMLLCRMLKCESKTMALLLTTTTTLMMMTAKVLLLLQIYQFTFQTKLSPNHTLFNGKFGWWKEEGGRKQSSWQKMKKKEKKSRAQMSEPGPRKEREREQKRMGEESPRQLSSIVCSVFRLFLFSSILSLSMARWQNTRLVFSQVVASSCFCLVLG